MADVLSRFDAMELVILVAVGGGISIGFICAVTAIVGAFWAEARDKEMAATLVQDMLDRDVPSEEIAGIVRAAALQKSPEPGSARAGHAAVEFGTLGYWDRKVKRLTIVDLKLAQAAAMAAMLVVVKWFPEILGLSVWWFLAALAILAVRPAYVFWLGDDPPHHAAAATACRQVG